MRAVGFALAGGGIAVLIFRFFYSVGRGAAGSMGSKASPGDRRAQDLTLLAITIGSVVLVITGVMLIAIGA